MIILGIDPGTATTGYGIIQQEKRPGDFCLLDFGVIETDKKHSDPQRLETLAKDIKKIIRQYSPQSVGVEKLFFEKNQKTAMQVSQARGVILLTCQQSAVPIFEFTPLQVKQFICGYGKAEKKQVQYIIQKIFSLKAPPKPDDAADAVAIALATAHYSKNRLIR